MSSEALTPKRLLRSLANKPVVVRLKWNRMEYRGNLLSVDHFMNVLLDDAVEIVDGVSTPSLGRVLIRCNNVQFLRALDDVSAASEPAITAAITAAA
jgi:small nuclear ribonucleoprotein F